MRITKETSREAIGHLPTAHGFDEFFGSLYHLNAEDEPEHPDYFKDPEMRKRFGACGVIHAWANPNGTQKIEGWIATAKHPKTGRLYTEMAYQPVIELLAYPSNEAFPLKRPTPGGSRAPVHIR